MQKWGSVMAYAWDASGEEDLLIFEMTRFIFIIIYLKLLIMELN